MKRLLFVLLLSTAGCSYVDPVPTGPTCADACANGARIGCDWSLATPAGASCEVVCQNAATFVPWNLDCLSRTDSCDRLACP